MCVCVCTHVCEYAEPLGWRNTQFNPSENEHPNDKLRTEHTNRSNNTACCANTDS